MPKRQKNLHARCGQTETIVPHLYRGLAAPCYRLTNSVHFKVKADFVFGSRNTPYM